MIRKAILLAVLLSGCATQPHISDNSDYVPEAVVDNDCIGIAKYARAVALLRDLNMNINRVSHMLVQPPFTYDTRPLQEAVYVDKNNPENTSVKVYMECVDEGYQNLLTRLVIERNMRIVLATTEMSK